MDDCDLVHIRVGKNYVTKSITLLKNKEIGIKKRYFYASEFFTCAFLGKILHRLKQGQTHSFLEAGCAIYCLKYELLG